MQFDDGERKTLLMRALPLRDEAGAVQGAVCAAADVTERHRYESHLKLALNELNHRVKNTLAVVQSIAAMSFRGIDATAREEFDRRLQTLGAVHERLLTDQNWDGLDLHDVARGSLGSHLGGKRERLKYDGENFRVLPKSAPCALDGAAQACHQRAEIRRAFGRRWVLCWCSGTRQMAVSASDGKNATGRSSARRRKGASGRE